MGSVLFAAEDQLRHVWPGWIFNQRARRTVPRRLQHANHGQATRLVHLDGCAGGDTMCCRGRI